MKVEVKRIDHLGIVAGTIKDLDIVDMINKQVGSDDQEEISSGEVIAGMIMNGLGFVSRPLMLTPQFFENKALEVLVKEGVKAEHFNRHKIGRVLDRIGDYGCEKLFGIIALEACRRENVDMKFGHSDTTSHSVTGDYDSESDTERINVTYGHSKAKRPDLKQVVQELVTSQDGGIPFMTKVWSGNASDSVILRERAKALMEEFSKSSNRYLVADSKLYAEETAKTLNKINFITRVPSTLKLEQASVDRALEAPDLWSKANKGYKLQEFPIDCYDIEDQRWVVIHSEQARERSEKTLKKEVARENERIKKELFHLQAERFSCETDAKKKLISLAKKWKYHQVSDEQITSVKRHAKRGRPTAQSPQEYEWQIKAQFALNQSLVDKALNQRSCFVLATNVSSKDLPMDDVLIGYKGQDKTEKGFAFLKSPDFFASSLFLKKPSRIDGLLMIMVLSLLVYSIAQRRLRMQLVRLKSTLPNQINKPIQNPTMRWIFQLFEGINYVTLIIKGVTTKIVEGVNALRAHVIELLSPNVQAIYQNYSAGG
jgi:transposase